MTCSEVDLPVPDNDSLFGYMKDTMWVEGDVIAPVDEKWSALSGDEDHLYTRRSKCRFGLRPFV